MGKEPISQEAKRVLEEIRKTEISENFYLAGGTALALQLNHRESIDLDWFTAGFFANKKILNILSEVGDFKINQEEEGTIHGILDGVKVSFLHYKYDNLFPLVDFEGIKIADERDIATMKLDAISSRGTKKDFIDLFFLLKKYSLKELLEIFEKKYSGINYNKIHLLKSLVYFNDGEDEPMPKMIEPANWEDVKKELQKKTEEFLERE